MSSNINPNNINGNFPVAGQDNDSQGFRDNFTNIVNNFSFAATEITGLQNAITSAQTVVQSNGNVEAYYGNVAQGLTVNKTTHLIGATAVDSTLTVAGNVVASKFFFANNISLSSAIQFANLTTTQIGNISPTCRGMTVYNYTTGNIQVYNGTKWANIQLS